MELIIRIDEEFYTSLHNTKYSYPISCMKNCFMGIPICATINKTLPKGKWQINASIALHPKFSKNSYLEIEYDTREEALDSFNNEVKMFAKVIDNKDSLFNFL